VHVATVSERGKLNIEMRLKKGPGLRECRPELRQDLPLGFIRSIRCSSPVRKVNFSGGSGPLGADD